MLKPKNKFPSYIAPTNPEHMAKYTAVVRHLHYQSFPRPPLPELIFSIIGSDMVKKKGAWHYSPKKAVSSTMEGLKAHGIELETPLPEEAFALHLKSLCHGMYAAFQTGSTQGPVDLGISASNCGEIFIERNTNGSLSLFFGDFPSLSKTLGELQRLIDDKTYESAACVVDTMNQIAGIGFKAQCDAHFAHTHMDLMANDTAEYIKQRAAYIEQQEEKYAKSHVTGRNGGG